MHVEQGHAGLHEPLEGALLGAAQRAALAGIQARLAVGAQLGLAAAARLEAAVGAGVDGRERVDERERGAKRASDIEVW
jgi:hypothetical protein